MTDAAEEFDERPASLLAQELRFNFFGAIMTTAITLIGGAVVLKGALLPDAPYELEFFVGVAAAAFAGICAFDGQMGVVARLEKRTSRLGLWARAIHLVTPWILSLGAVLLGAYFSNNFPTSGS